MVVIIKLHWLQKLLVVKCYMYQIINLSFCQNSTHYKFIKTNLILFNVIFFNQEVLKYLSCHFVTIFYLEEGCVFIGPCYHLKMNFSISFVENLNPYSIWFIINFYSSNCFCYFTIIILFITNELCHLNYEMDFLIQQNFILITSFDHFEVLNSRNQISR